MRDVFSQPEWLRVARHFQFTPSELQVAQALFDDKSEEEIARELGISQEAVSASLEQLFSKTGTSSPLSFALGLYARLRAEERPPKSGPSRKR